MPIKNKSLKHLALLILNKINNVEFNNYNFKIENLVLDFANIVKRLLIICTIHILS